MADKKKKQNATPESAPTQKIEVRLAVATPCSGGQVTEGYLQSMFGLVAACMELRVPIMLLTISNESLITRGRNELVNQFLKTNCTHLMFIDADIQFQPDDVIKMLKNNVDMVAGSYPLKTIAWDQIKDMQDAKGGKASVEDLMHSAFQTVINVSKPDPEKVGKSETVQIINGMVEVYDVGTGFMLIKRHVIEKMIEAYPETLFYHDKDLSLPLEERARYALFDVMIDEDKRYLSEDYTFCRRWQKLGGKVMLNVGVKLNHIGTYTFRGPDIIRQDQKQP